MYDIRYTIVEKVFEEKRLDSNEYFDFCYFMARLAKQVISW